MTTRRQACSGAWAAGIETFSLVLEHSACEQIELKFRVQVHIYGNSCNAAPQPVVDPACVLALQT